MAIYSAFADVLDYPAYGLEDRLAEIALECPEARAAMGQAARAKVAREHDLPVAAARLGEAIGRLFRVPAT